MLPLLQLKPEGANGVRSSARSLSFEQPGSATRSWRRIEGITAEYLRPTRKSRVGQIANDPMESATALLQHEFSDTCEDVEATLERRRDTLWIHLSFTLRSDRVKRRVSHVLTARVNPKEAAVLIAIRSALSKLRSGIDFAAGATTSRRANGFADRPPPDAA